MSSPVSLSVCAAITFVRGDVALREYSSTQNLKSQMLDTALKPLDHSEWPPEMLTHKATGRGT